MFGISRCLRWICHLSRTTSNRSPIHLSGFCGIISDFPRRRNQCNLDEEISLARVALAKPWRTRRRHEATATTQNALNPIPGAFKLGHFLSIRAIYRRNRRRAYTHTYVSCVRACVQGFINWITPDETSVRDASGYPRGERPFRATLLHLFLSVQRSASRFNLHLLLVFLLLLPFSPSPLPPPAISLLSRRQDTGTDGRGNHDPLCPSRGLRRGRFQPRIPLTFRIRGIKHFSSAR